MTRIICEIGSNWQTFEHCIASIEMAKSHGADAVKFQLFTPHALYGISDHDDRAFFYQSPYLNPEWLPRLKAHADVVGIEFMCTAFSPELVAAVDPYVSTHKIASSDLSYPQLLKAVAKTGKPCLLSTGASSRGDIEWALNYLNRSNTTLLYCVSSYPARTVDLRVMELLSVYGCPVGYSDHTTDIIGTPVMSARMGATVIEKHVTAFPELVTPDRPHSLTPTEFKIMVDYIRGTRVPMIAPTPEELPMLMRHNRRLIATRDIEPGEMLSYGYNYGAYRSCEDDAHGLTPFIWDHVTHGPETKPALHFIAKGQGIGPGDFGHMTAQVSTGSRVTASLNSPDRR